MIKVLIKRKNKNIKLPKYETPGASGLDICACIDENIILKKNKTAVIPTGLFMSIPEGYEIQIRPRSGLAAKKHVTVLNTPGTIDSDYRGEIKVILINLGEQDFEIENGLRIAQMVVSPVVKAELEEVDQVSETLRDKGGFGSTGLK